MQVTLRQTDRILLLGLGDNFRGDEGVGQRALEMLERRFLLPPNVSVLAARVPDLDVLDALEEVRLLIAVDHVYADQLPGAFFRVELNEYEREPEAPESVNEGALLSCLGVVELLGRRPWGVLYVVNVNASAPGSGLSADVEAALPRLTDEIVAELERAGVPVARRYTV